MLVGGNQTENDMSDSFTMAKVQKLFQDTSSGWPGISRNPVTGGHWVPGLDSSTRQITLANRALHAAATRAVELPPEFNRLPLTYDDRKKMKGGHPLAYLVAFFARSLAYHDYREDHPCFSDYACSALATEYAPEYVREADYGERYFAKLTVPIGPGVYWICPA